MQQPWQTQLEQVLALLEAGEIEEGLAKLEIIRDTYEEDATLQLQLVNVYHELGHQESALEILEQLEERQDELDADTQIEMNVYRASLYIDLDRLQEAMDILLAIKEKGTDDYRVYALLGELFLIEGLDEVAIRYFEEALTLTPGNEEIQYLLGKLYAEQGESDRAMEQWKSLEGFDEDEAILLERARLAARQGEFEEAFTLYQKLLETKETPQALYGAGAVVYQMGDWQAAVRYLARLIEVDADYIAGYPLLAEALWKLNMREQALAIYQRVLTLPVDEEYFLPGYLRMVIDMEKWEEAEEALHRLYELDDEDPVYWYWRGRMAEAKGEFEEARHCYEQVMDGGEIVADAQQRYQNLIRH
jgi:tetratricopeptide (TPR) repeat protein